MTQQVRAGYRRHRKATWAVLLVVATVGALAASVLPATGATGDQTGLPSDPLGAVPIENSAGGNTYSCPSGYSQFKINNPKSGTYSTTVSGVNVSFTIAVSGGANRDKYLSFKSNIAAVGVVAINGGTKTAEYTYAKPAIADGYGSGTTNPLTVDVDGTNGKIGLHAPVDSSGNPYSLSYTTFCFNLPTVMPSCSDPFSGVGFSGTAGSVDYAAQLVSPDGTTCKGSNVIMYSYTSGTSSFYATLNPVTENSGATKYRVIERIRWSGITGSGQTLVPNGLWYDDTFPYDGGDKKTLKLCNLDARSTSDPFTLANDPNTGQPYTDAQILPTGETSCMFVNTNSAGTGLTDRIYEAWIYSNVDGARGVT